MNLVCHADGLCMSCQWALHVLSMGLACLADGPCMSCRWALHVLSMGLACLVDGPCMSCRRALHVLSTGLACYADSYASGRIISVAMGLVCHADGHADIRSHCLCCVHGSFCTLFHVFQVVNMFYCSGFFTNDKKRPSTSNVRDVTFLTMCARIAVHTSVPLAA